MHPTSGWAPLVGGAAVAVAIGFVGVLGETRFGKEIKKPPSSPLTSRLELSARYRSLKHLFYFDV